MNDPAPAPSARRDELLNLTYQYVTRNGLADMSLRPLATVVGSSPRVLLFLFGSKDDLIRTLLARARQDQLDLFGRARGESAPADLTAAVRSLWRWLTAPTHRPLLRLWLEAYAQSLRQPDGPSMTDARRRRTPPAAPGSVARPRGADPRRTWEERLSGQSHIACLYRRDSASSMGWCCGCPEAFSVFHRTRLIATDSCRLPSALTMVIVCAPQTVPS